MSIVGIDHLVLTVEDVDRTCEFYLTVLNAEIRTFGNGRTALRFGDQKINLHPAANPYSLRAENARTGTGDFCLITADPIESVVSRLEKSGVDIEVGPIDKDGAQGPLRSVYIRYPDQNLVEIATYQ